eukprot:gnl/TRDRNA2_/TRDRNA2_152037_c0_seq1.p1 gnl/TRDRNA2_/TRDRNA2_152037_c0~~gnl/TRDRNA2_/TRDRNA2_152037_c0_seq1.p1  ORF type:complete len:285 (+),score=53.39 gnl/TRDRNA2_/TRDRNA2_152037_c0_seq1:126-857(+)
MVDVPDAPGALSYLARLGLVMRISRPRQLLRAFHNNTEPRPPTQPPSNLTPPRVIRSRALGWPLPSMPHLSKWKIVSPTAVAVRREPNPDADVLEWLTDRDGFVFWACAQVGGRSGWVCQHPEEHTTAGWISVDKADPSSQGHRQLAPVAVVPRHSQWRVISSVVAVREEPSTDAKCCYVIKEQIGLEFWASEEVDGWVRQHPDFYKSPGWILIDAKHLGHGQLLELVARGDDDGLFDSVNEP